METTTTRTFSTVEEVFQACEEAGMMTRTQHGGLGEISHWVDINHKDYNAPMTCFWSDHNLISWANAYFNLIGMQLKTRVKMKTTIVKCHCFILSTALTKSCD